MLLLSWFPVSLAEVIPFSFISFIYALLFFCWRELMFVMFVKLKMSQQEKMKNAHAMKYFVRFHRNNKFSCGAKERKRERNERKEICSNERDEPFTWTLPHSSFHFASFSSSSSLAFFFSFLFHFHVSHNTFCWTFLYTFSLQCAATYVCVLCDVCERYPLPLPLDVFPFSLSSQIALSHSHRHSDTHGKHLDAFWRRNKKERKKHRHGCLMEI